MNSLVAPPRVRIREIAFTPYPVTDLARARIFYEELLGLSPATVWAADGKGWIEYEIGSSTLAISNMAADQWVPAKQGPSAALEAVDFAEAVDALRRAGAVFYMDPTAGESCQMAVISDPDGNSLILHQRAGAPLSTHGA